MIFASLFVAMILPFSGMDFASAQKTGETITDNGKQKVTDDQRTYDFLENLMQPGEYVKEKKTNENKDARMTNIVTELGNEKYLLHSEFEYDGEIIDEQLVILTQNDDGSINMKNIKAGLNVDFYKSDRTIQTELSEFVDQLIPYVFAGSGSSDGSGAVIQLYDSKYGTLGNLKLSDSYSGCGGPMNNALMSATVTPVIVDVSWGADYFYWHWCIIPRQFSDGKVTSEGKKYYFDESERKGYHAFTHSGGENYYSAGVSFYYGTW